MNPPSRPNGEATQPDGGAREASRNVHRLTLGDKEVLLIGTAHISSKSAKEVAAVIEAEKPDSVCVELCEARHQSLTRPDAWRDMDIIEVLKKKQATTLLAHLLLASFQRKLGDQLGIKPGAEMLQAIQSGEL